MSEDRYTYPGEGETSRDIDREMADAETVARKQTERQVSHPQRPERQQGTSADTPGWDPSDREREGEPPPAR
jgi:hypothetical protein